MVVGTTSREQLGVCLGGVSGTTLSRSEESEKISGTGPKLEAAGWLRDAGEE